LWLERMLYHLKSLKKLLERRYHIKVSHMLRLYQIAILTLVERIRCNRLWLNLDWIDSITMPKKKWDALPEEEKITIFNRYLKAGSRARVL